jgi:phosphatidylglycerophosphate synthase
MEASTVRGFARSYQAGLTELRLAQKSPRGTAAYSRHINRPAARRVAALLNMVSFTPNMATAVSALLSAAGLVLAAVIRPTPLVGVIVALLLAAGYVMDSVDGQLARLRGGGSFSGEMLDHAVDCVKTVGIHLTVLISWFRFPPTKSSEWLLVPIGFQIIDVLIFFGVVTMPLLRRLHDRDLTVQSSNGIRPEHPLRRWALLPTDYGIFCWMFALLGWPLLFVIAYCAMFLVNVVVLFPVLAKWRWELRRMDLTA